MEHSNVPTRDWLVENTYNKSGAIRYLANLGLTVKEISDHLGVRYNQVYNIVQRMDQNIRKHVCPVCNQRKDIYDPYQDLIPNDEEE
jgi:orotate phosphoribosyltransferase-like protein